MPHADVQFYPNSSGLLTQPVLLREFERVVDVQRYIADDFPREIKQTS